MQKDWITTGNAACSGIAGWWRLRSGLGAPVQFVQRLPVAGAGLESLLSFARQLPASPTNSYGPVDSATDSSRRSTPHPLDSPGAGRRPAASLPPWDVPEHAAVPIVIQSFCITPILAFLNDF
jgi:hypothetical protein